MTRWNRRTLQQRLGIGLGVMVALIVVVALMAIVSARAGQHNLDDLYNVRLVAIDAVMQADRDLQQLLVAERSTIFSDVGSPVFDQLLKDHEENLQQSNDRWQKYRALATSPEEQPFVAGYEKARAEWQALTRQVIEGRRADTMEGRALAIDLTLGPARDKFNEMREQLNSAQEHTLSLAAHQYDSARATASVSRIIKTIDEIAFQTNLLALNAAVEAARAGEAGMGFAVVADEVRTLAQRAAQAARDTATLIEESMARSKDGSAKVEGVRASIRTIDTAIGELTGLVSEVGDASQQQAQGIGQLSQGVTQLQRSTQESAASAEEGAAASEELHAQARHTLHLLAQLDALVGKANDSNDHLPVAAAATTPVPPASRRPSVVPPHGRIIPLRPTGTKV